MLDAHCVPTSPDENIAIVKTGNECQLSAYMVLLGKFSTLMPLTRCLQSCAPERTTDLDTAQAERVLIRLVDLMTPHLWTAVCISQAEECLHDIHVLTLFRPALSLPVSHAQLFVVRG